MVKTRIKDVKTIEKILRNQKYTFSSDGKNEKRIDYCNIDGIGFIDEKTNKMQIIYPTSNISDDEVQDRIRYISRLKEFLKSERIKFYEDENSKKECLEKIQDKINHYKKYKEFVEE